MDRALIKKLYAAATKSVDLSLNFLRNLNWIDELVDIIVSGTGEPVQTVVDFINGELMDVTKDVSSICVEIKKLESKGDHDKFNLETQVNEKYLMNEYPTLYFAYCGDTYDKFENEGLQQLLTDLTECLEKINIEYISKKTMKQFNLNV